jgi:hypothetical protein
LLPLGPLLAALLSASLGAVIGWRGLFAIGLVPAAFAFVIRLWVPESPRWLFGQGRFEDQGADLRNTPIPQGDQLGDSRIAIVATLFARFGQLYGGAFRRPFERVSRGEKGMDQRMARKLASRPFEPEESLFCPRLDQMHATNPEITVPNEGIARAELNGLFVKPDRLLHISAEELAPPLAR